MLAISPTNGGFGFVVFEGPERLIDWGLKTARTTTGAKRLKLAPELFERYTPDALVIEDLAEKGSRRGRKASELLVRIARLSSQTNVETVRISRSAIKGAFAQFNSTTKYQIAATIAARLPELAPRLPKPRKPWMSEDSRMSIFDAAALALTFLSGQTEST